MDQRIGMAAFAALCLAGAGCTTVTSRKPHAITEGKLDIYVTDNDQKLLFVKDMDADEHHRVCLTPPHDSVSGPTGGFGLSGGVPLIPALKGGVAIEHGKGELALGGRSPAALISRELLYRACELTLNINADRDTSFKIYERFLQALEKVAAAQTESGTAPLSLAEAAPDMRQQAAPAGGDEPDPNANDGGAVDPNPPPPQSGGTVETGGLNGGSGGKDDE